MVVYVKQGDLQRRPGAQNPIKLNWPSWLDARTRGHRYSTPEGGLRIIRCGMTWPSGPAAPRGIF